MLKTFTPLASFRRDTCGAFCVLLTQSTDRQDDPAALSAISGIQQGTQNQLLAPACQTAVPGSGKWRPKSLIQLT